MKAEAIPMIRLSLENMKHQMMSTLGLYENELSEAVEAQLDQALTEFDFGQVVKTCLHSAIFEIVNEFFKCGEGKKALKTCTDALMMNIFETAIRNAQKEKAKTPSNKKGDD